MPLTFRFFSAFVLLIAGSYWGRGRGHAPRPVQRKTLSLLPLAPKFSCKHHCGKRLVLGD